MSFPVIGANADIEFATRQMFVSWKDLLRLASCFSGLQSVHVFGNLKIHLAAHCAAF